MGSWDGFIRYSVSLRLMYSRCGLIDVGQIYLPGRIVEECFDY